MPNIDIAFACVFSGDKYSFDYVRKLKTAIDIHCSMNVPFYCLSIKKHLASCQKSKITLQELPEELPGWWNKIYLFDKNIIPTRYIFFIDLDVVILRNIDEVFEYIKRADVIYAQDTMDLMSSSLLIVDRYSKLASDVLENFNLNTCLQTCVGDQDYFSRFINEKNPKVLGLPCKFHYSYKYLLDYDNWRAKSNNSNFFEVSINDIYMLNFHGFPKPHDIAANPENWCFSNKILKNWSLDSHQLLSVSPAHQR